MSGIFISYRRADTITATRLIKEKLQSHFADAELFMDIDSIRPGVDFEEKIDETLGRCDVMLAIIGPQWLKRLTEEGGWICLEVERAIARKIPIIPVLIDDAKMPSKDALPINIQGFAKRQATKLDTGQDFAYHMQRLIEAIEFHRENANQIAYQKLRELARKPSAPGHQPSVRTIPQQATPLTYRDKVRDGKFDFRGFVLVWVIAGGLVLVIAILAQVTAH